MRDGFTGAFPWGAEAFRAGFGGKWHLDLEDANARQLMEAGVPDAQMVRPGICTVENADLFFSHRLEAAAHGDTGRFATIIMVKKR